MKKLMLFTTVLALAILQLSARAQEHKERITKSFPYSKGTIAIYNVYGSIQVKGYPGKEVIMDIITTVQAKDQQTLELGKKELKLGFEQHENNILAFITSPHDSRPDRLDINHKKPIPYSYQVVFTISVPFEADLLLTTVNNGNISVKDVAGTLTLNNINGSIEIENAKGTTQAQTVNGSITASYLSSPPSASSYLTINGSLKMIYPASLTADLQCSSVNGNIHTDFSNAAIIEGNASASKKNKGFVIDKNATLRIGKGGRLLKFITINGNIHIQEAS